MRLQVLMQQQGLIQPPRNQQLTTTWLIGRCSRRRDSRTDHDRCRRYEERVAILRCSQSALHSPVESLRVATLRTLGNMSDT